jgi:chaperonin GroES
MAVATAIRLKPLGDRVLVKAVEKKDEIRSGIIIPDTAKEKPQEGEVVAVGKGKVGEDGKLIPMDVKAGDKILYGKYSGTEVKIEGQEYLIMHQEDILGIVEG